jgi:hypothetical protein
MASVSIERGLDFILSHFDQGFPRRISTKTSENVQILVFNKEEALARFEAAKYLDCKINAYPYVKRWKGWEGINRQVPNLLFIDKDLENFKDKEALDISLYCTLETIKDKLGANAVPSVLWSGHGYHIILPVNSILLEGEEIFRQFDNPSSGLLRYAEKCLSNDSADKCHSSTMSINNCMLRIPGSYNAKGQLEEVKIIQKWNGYRPNTKPLMYNCFLYLQAAKINKLQYEHTHPPGEFCRYWKKTI